MPTVVQLPLHATNQTQALMIGTEFLPSSTTPEALIRETAAQMISNPDVSVEILLAAMHKLLRTKPEAMFQLVIEAGAALDQSALRRLSWSNRRHAKARKKPCQKYKLET